MNIDEKLHLYMAEHGIQRIDLFNINAEELTDAIGETEVDLVMEAIIDLSELTHLSF